MSKTSERSVPWSIVEKLIAWFLGFCSLALTIIGALIYIIYGTISSEAASMRKDFNDQTLRTNTELTAIHKEIADFRVELVKAVGDLRLEIRANRNR